MNSSDALGTTKHASPGNTAAEGNSGHRGSPLSQVHSQSDLRLSGSSGGRGPSTSVADEETPIINGNGPMQPRYQSTEGLRHREVFQGNEQADGRRASDAGRSQDRPDRTDGTRPSWFRRIVENYGTLELENKGSVARDHLALERTFLAWLRTSLAFASVGIAVTQLFRLNTAVAPPDKRSESSTWPTISDARTGTMATSPASGHLRAVGKPLGATFVGVAILILFVGFHRYFESQYWIIRGKFPASRGSVTIVAFTACALIVASFIVILAITNGAVRR